MTMTTRIIVSIAAAAALVAAVHAQEAPPLKLTPETLAQAIADGESQQPRGLPVVAARIERWLSGTVAPQTLGKMTAEYALMPYDVYLLTPFVRAASTAADAKRRAIAMPAMTPDGVNADGVVVSIVPGPGANARSIASVTLKRGEEVIRPIKSAVQPPAADGRVSGAFYFRLEDFSALPVTLECAGNGRARLPSLRRRGRTRGRLRRSTSHVRLRLPAFRRDLPICRHPGLSRRIHAALS